MVQGGLNRSPVDPAMRARLKSGMPPANKMYLGGETAYAADGTVIGMQAPQVFPPAGVQPSDY